MHNLSLFPVGWGLSTTVHCTYWSKLLHFKALVPSWYSYDITTFQSSGSLMVQLWDYYISKLWQASFFRTLCIWRKNTYLLKEIWRLTYVRHWVLTFFRCEDRFVWNHCHHSIIYTDLSWLGLHRVTAVHIRFNYLQIRKYK